MKKEVRFYDPTTRARIELVPKVKGDGFRAANIRDARKEGFVPSVTEICGMWKNIALEVYRETNILKAAYAAPPIADEPYDQWSRHIKDTADEHRKEAADFGTNTHAAFDRYIKGLEPVTKTHAEFLQHIGPSLPLINELYAEAELLIDETPIVGKGYAGTVDKAWYYPDRHHIEIVDFKTQGLPASRKKFNFYESWVIQLALYSYAILYDYNKWEEIPDNKGVDKEIIRYRDMLEGMNVAEESPPTIQARSIVIERDGSKTDSKLWTSSELARAFQVGIQMRDCWSYFNEYDPTHINPSI